MRAFIAYLDALTEDAGSFGDPVEKPEPLAPTAAPDPVPGRVTSQQISQIAAGDGVPGSLASAIA